MTSQIFTLHNPSGLHARPATLFVQIAGQLQSVVKIQNLDRGTPEVNGKSILEVLTLGAGPGQRIEVRVDGADEQTGLAELAEAIESGLGESAA
jgi:multiphosphoryl transfer protein